MKAFKRIILVVIIMVASLSASAYDFMVNGICYNKNSDGNTVTVTYQNSSSPRYSNASGSLNIPSSVYYSGKTYSVTAIDDYAFYNCSGFTGSLTIPNSVTKIGTDAFRGCNGFTGSLTIGNSVTSIGYQAFRDCRGFTSSLNIPNSVTYISSRAFSGCSGFTGSLTIGNSVNQIMAEAFSGCSGLNKLIFNAIDYGNFTTNNHPFQSLQFQNVVIGNSVQRIPAYLLYGHSEITSSLTIPNSVTSIGEAAFYNCSGFTGSLTIGNSVTSIGNYAFNGCSGFTGSLTIPESVTSIGGYAFSNCSGFTSIKNYIPHPSNASMSVSVFSGMSTSTCTLYVPRGTVEEYRVADQWKDFSNILEGSWGDLISVTSVTVSPSSASLNVGQTTTLTATVAPSNATNKNVTWISSNTSVATVSANGTTCTVTAKAAGTATITCTAQDGSGKKGTCTVTVTNPNVLVTSVTVSPSTSTLTVGSTATLTATVAPSNATNKNVTWTSSNTSVATVSANGTSCTVTAKAAGTATITCTAQDGSGKKGTCTVTVQSSGGQGSTTGTVQVGNTNSSERSEGMPICNWWMHTYQGCEVIYYADELRLQIGDEITDLSYYFSNNLRDDGLYGGYDFPGGNFNVRVANTTASQLTEGSTLLSTSNAVNGNVQLGSTTVGNWITFHLSSPLVYSGGNIVVDIRNAAKGTRTGWIYFAGFDDTNHTKRSVAWANATNENGSGASENGSLTPGSWCPTTRFAYTRSANVPVTSVTVSPSTSTLTVGSTATLTATVAPSNATNKNVTWTSSNTSVATVSGSGTTCTVTAKAAGTATITCTAQDGSGKKGTCTVTVTQPVTSVTVSPSTSTLTVGSTATLTATVAPSNATNKNVTWTSSNTSVATVSANGTSCTVTAKAAGTATITCTAQDGSGKKGTCTVTVNAAPSGDLPKLTAPDLTLNSECVGQVTALPLTLTMPTGSNFKMIQIELTYPDGLVPIADSNGNYGETGADIPLKNGAPVTEFQNNFEVANYWPTYKIIGSGKYVNSGFTPVSVNPCQLYTAYVAPSANYTSGDRDIKVAVKYIDSNDQEYTIGSWDEPVKLCTVHFEAQVACDVNGDGRVDVDDLGAVINLILERTNAYATTADVNSDGQVNVFDVNYIIDYILAQ